MATRAVSIADTASIHGRTSKVAGRLAPATINIVPQFPVPVVGKFGPFAVCVEQYCPYTPFLTVVCACPTYTVLCCGCCGAAYIVVGCW